MCFKRWTRKPYGIFASLKKEVKIGVVSIGCSLMALVPQVGYAQQAADSTHSTRLNDVEVSAQRQQVYSDLARVVTVVSKEEIAKAPVQTVADLLRYVSGVDVRQRGANGVQTDVSVRGGTFDQVLILLNGVNITDPQTGHHNLNIPVELSAIDRIEVLQGPGSRVLGPNAFSGAINIITGTADKTGVAASVVGGNNGFIAQGASATLVSGKVSSFAAVSNSRSEGYIGDTDFDMTNAFAQVRINSNSLGKVNVQAGYQEKEFGAYGFYSLNPKYANEFEKTRTLFASVSADKSFGKLSISPKAYWRQHHDRFELFRDGVGAYKGYKHNYHQTDVMGAALSASYLSKLGKTSVGVDFRSEHIYSNALGDSLKAPIQVQYEPDSTFFYKQKSRENLNFFIDHAVYLNKFSASIGLLGNQCEDFGFNSYFGADMGYAFTPAFKVYTTVNQSLRIPTFTDLYLQTSTQAGNADLKPEQAMTYELGLKYSKGRLSANLSGYYREGKDVIDWIKESSSDLKYKAVNHAEINAQGLESAVEYRPAKYITRIKLSYSHLELDKQSTEFDSKYALDYLRDKVSIDFDHDIYKGFSAAWRFNWSDRAGSFKDATNATVKYSSFWLTDLRLQWSSKTITVFGEATNLFGQRYVDYGGIAQPGCWLKSGISIKL